MEQKRNPGARAKPKKDHGVQRKEKGQGKAWKGSKGQKLIGAGSTEGNCEMSKENGPP